MRLESNSHRNTFGAIASSFVFHYYCNFTPTLLFTRGPVSSNQPLISRFHDHTSTESGMGPYKSAPPAPRDPSGGLTNTGEGAHWGNKCEALVVVSGLRIWTASLAIWSKSIVSISPGVKTLVSSRDLSWA